MKEISELEWRNMNREELKNSFIKDREEEFKKFIEDEYKSYLRCMKYDNA